MLRIENFSKSYMRDKSTYAVQALSIEVHTGDIYGFIGHNGAGKTTTLRAIAGILPFDGGDIYIDNLSIREQPIECKRRIAYVPDNPELYPSLTGEQYLDFIANIFQVSLEQRKQRVGRYAQMLEIDGNLSTQISAYSRGMKQKLAIVSALLHDPKLLVFDEPFVGLDPKAIFTFRGMMNELCEQGHAILFSTHVLEVAQKLCNRVGILSHGHLVAQGDMDEVVGQHSLEDVFLELSENAAITDTDTI